MLRAAWMVALAAGARAQLPTVSPSAAAPAATSDPTQRPSASPFPTLSPQPSLSPAPTATFAPTPRHKKKSSSRSYDLPVWAQVLLSIMFVLFFLIPCLCFFNHAIIHQRPLPDMGGIYTHSWYDEYRGQLFLFAFFLTLGNFFALYCAAMAASGDGSGKDALLSFGVALIQATKNNGKRDGLFLGLYGYTYARGTKAQEYFEFGASRPNDSVVTYDYDWQTPCKQFGKAAFWLLIPAGLIKAVSMFVLYKRTYATEDTPTWRFVGTFTEFACFCAMLGVTIQFYTGCWRYLPNEGSRMHFPVSGLPNKNQKVRIVAPFVASIAICVAAFCSLLVSWIHFRMPCWLSSTNDPDWF